MYNVEKPNYSIPELVKRPSPPGNVNNICLNIIDTMSQRTQGRGSHRPGESTVRHSDRERRRSLRTHQLAQCAIRERPGANTYIEDDAKSTAHALRQEPRQSKWFTAVSAKHQRI